MKTGNALPWSFYGLCLTLAFLGHATGVQLPEPPPVDCSYSRWSPWTPCNPCTNMRRRSRGIDAFGQFAGQPCQEALSESEACTTDAACVVRPSAGCSAADFQCGSGACIRKRLACNYDFDCEDQTDEDVCGRMSRKPCGTRAVDTQYRGGSTMGQGINILGPTPSKRVLYNGYFGGVCQFSGSSGIRVPGNVAWLNLETHAEKTVSVGVYASSQRLVREVLTESRVNVAGGLSFRSTRVQKSVGQETKNVIKDIVKESPGKSKGYVRVKAKVQSATYRLKPRDLKLSDGFSRDVESLPIGYEKGSYFDFIEDYGTHYAGSGRLGGQYELVYVLNTDQIRKRGLSETGILPCFRDVASDTGVGATGSARTSSCILNKDDWKAVVDKVLVTVEGGDLASASAMEARINTDGQLNAETYQNWARSIANYPGLLYSEQDPIYNAFPLGMPDANTRIANMKRAIADYVAEYSVCKCKPCHNNGTVVLIDGTCSCLCTAAFEGVACQNHEADEAPAKSNDEPRPGAPRPGAPRPGEPRPGAPRPGAPRPGAPRPGEPRPSVPSPSVSHEGNWACWSGWSTCSGAGERSRRRACNVDGLPPGGVCSGEVTEADAC